MLGVSNMKIVEMQEIKDHFSKMNIIDESELKDYSRKISGKKWKIISILSNRFI